jgi:L,D-transpeptidase ErfK/SrfK
MSKNFNLAALTLGSLIAVSSASALTFSTPAAGNDIVGKLQLITVGMRNRVDISEQYDVGKFEMIEANPGVNLKQLNGSQRLVVPTEFILPKAPRKGVVINLAAMRLYYYTRDGKDVLTFPVGIGKVGWATPMGTTKVIEKVKDPAWVPTKSVRADFLKRYGYPLPQIVLSGPDNPLGHYMMRLDWPAYLMHGTNSPAGVGSRVSAGCIRMFDWNAGQLFQHVKIGTPVRVLYQPVKAGWRGNTLYLEAHLPIPGMGNPSYKPILKAAMRQRRGKVVVNWQKAAGVAKLDLGVPQAVGHLVTVKSRHLISTH